MLVPKNRVYKTIDFTVKENYKIVENHNSISPNNKPPSDLMAEFDAEHNLPNTDKQYLQTGDHVPNESK